jgi:cystathionine beta-lyase/cystathionine gamma-synthase
VFTCAESLGGVESLTELPAIMTHASLTPEARQALGVGDGLVRLSVSLEDAEDLSRKTSNGASGRRKPPFRAIRRHVLRCLL